MDEYSRSIGTFNLMDSMHEFDLQVLINYDLKNYCY